MSGPPETTQLAHQRLRTVTWPSSPPVIETPGESSIVGGDLEHCDPPCRHHPRSDKYPTVGDGQHIPNLQKFAEDLTDGLKAVFPNHQAIYNRVHALLISWGRNDDLGTEIEVDELKRLFEESYNFTVEKYAIPAELSEEQLEEKCMEVRRDHAGARDLLIVYYGGHGLFKGNKSIWHAWKDKPNTATVRRETSPELDWTEAHRSLMKARGDVLFILDCCYATFTTRVGPRGGTKELLAATSFKQTATGVHENSFTMALIRELKGIEKLPYTASMIHERLLNHYTNYKIAVPQYVALYRTLHAQSIVLAPQKAGDSVHPETGTEGTLVRQPKLMTDCRILISIALDNPYQPPDFTEWNEWFTKAAPRNIKNAKLFIQKHIRPEGAWESTSTFYLFSMPAALWNSIPSNPAYKMLAIIKSDNLLKPRYVSQGVQVEIVLPRVVEEAVEGVSSAPIFMRKATHTTTYGIPEIFWSRFKVVERSFEKTAPPSPQPHRARRLLETRFYGSQIGNAGGITNGYTKSPFKLLFQDIITVTRLKSFLPLTLLFLIPGSSSEPLSERFPSVGNITCTLIHLAILILQATFVILVPFAIFLPLWSVIAGVAIFWAINNSLCYLLNGSRDHRASSGYGYAKQLREHEHEQWIFMNGICVGSHWLQISLDRLALTFGRPVIGVHNKTNGFIFDFVQCLIQRSFNYLTASASDCHAVLKRTLYDPTISRIVLILHSQGAISGSMVIDKLLAEVPQDLLSKLEVYTFGNAANHFSNPYPSLLSQHRDEMGGIKTPSRFPDERGEDSFLGLPGHPSAKTGSRHGRAIRHIEHYANTTDPLARLGVLQDIFDPYSQSGGIFTGNIFERYALDGNLFCHDYLDKIFPLQRSQEREGIAGSGFSGAMEDRNEFMDSVVNTGGAATGRETLETSYFGAHGEPLTKAGPADSKFKDMLSFSRAREFEEETRVEFRVRDLSRLWLYRNGSSPKIEGEEGYSS